MSRRLFGTTKDGRAVHIYTIRNEAGMEASFLDFGASWVSMLVPDREGVMRDVLLGYDRLEQYEANPDYIGAIVGRVANRTEDAKFTLDGVTYQLEVNDGKNNNHTSHEHGFHKQLWTLVEQTDNSVSFSYHSPHMECGFPGNLDVVLTYILSNEGELSVTWKCVCDRRSIINLTCHAYFNLKGEGNGNCHDTKLRIDADLYTPLRDGSIPTGELAEVADTPFDFREFKRIGEDFWAGCEQQLIVGGGYDHTWSLRGEARELKHAVSCVNEESGITLDMFNDQPGVLLYTGNYIDNVEGKNGHVYPQYGGFCLETHGFSNAVNTPGFVSPVVEKDEEYVTGIIYKFGTV